MAPAGADHGLGQADGVQPADTRDGEPQTGRCGVNRLARGRRASPSRPRVDDVPKTTRTSELGVGALGHTGHGGHIGHVDTVDTHTVDTRTPPCASLVLSTYNDDRSASSPNHGYLLHRAGFVVAREVHAAEEGPEAGVGTEGVEPPGVESTEYGVTFAVFLASIQKQPRHRCPLNVRPGTLTRRRRGAPRRNHDVSLRAPAANAAYIPRQSSDCSKAWAAR